MNKTFKSILFVLNIVLITVIGLTGTSYICDAITFSIAPVAICCLILVFAKDFRPFGDRKNIKWDICFTGLFMVMLSLEEVLKTMRMMHAEPITIVFKVLYFPVVLACLIIDIDYILSLALADKPAKLDTSETGTDRFLGLYYPVWMFIAVIFFFVIAYYPGLMNSDFEKQWIWGEPTKYSDWHTVGYIFLVKICTFLTRKVFVLTIVQVLMYVIAANYAVGVLVKRFPQYPRIGWTYMYLYMIFGSYSCMYISEMRKDNVSTPMLLAFAISLLDYILARKHTKRQYINMGIFAFLASCFRHSLWQIVLVTLIVLMIREIGYKSADKDVKKKNLSGLFAVFVSTLVAFLIMTEGIAFGLLNAERNPAYINYTIPMNLAASMAYRSRETGLVIDDDIVAKMEQIIPMEEWAEYYCPFDADTTDRPWHAIGDNVYKLNDPAIAKDIIAVDWYYLTHYPKQCILSFFDVNSMVWEIAEANGLVMYAPGFAVDHTEIHHMRKGDYFFAAENVKEFMGSTAIGRCVVYRGGLYVFLMLMISFVLLRKRHAGLLIAMLPVVLYACALMISIPQEGPHYIMPFPLFTALFGVTAYFMQNGSKDKKT